MKINNKKDVIEVLKASNIQSGYLGNFSVSINKANLDEILSELGNHTAFKLSHSNNAISEGFDEHGVINYNLELNDDVLVGKCLHQFLPVMGDIKDLA